ncbi:protein Brevis radix-like 1 [Salvia divinorum]|uniref:Protein Brevis radix-like 1 n=1 Tax=Salvia divinorum TaxID=28513 RepID=A0ABD1GLF4_SALDI
MLSSSANCQDHLTKISESDSFKVVQAQVESLLHISGALASEGSSLRPPEPTRELNTQNIYKASVDNNGSSIGNTQSRLEGVPGTFETASAKAQKEVIEQFEPGVYVTLHQLSNGTQFLKRIRFRNGKLIDELRRRI